MPDLYNWYLIIHLDTIHRKLYIYMMHRYVTQSIVHAEWSDEIVKLSLNSGLPLKGQKQP